MLVLSRKYGESIVIGGSITVTVMKVKSNAVQLGIEAPKEIPVHRSELCQRIRENDTPPEETWDQGGRGELHDAVIDHRKLRVSELLATGSDVNRQDNGGWTPLHFAAHEQVVGIARMLIDAGAQVDSKDNFGNTPLWRAVFDYRGDGRVIVLLRKKAADVSVQNRSGVSPVGLARQMAKYGVAKFFLDVDN